MIKKYSLKALEKALNHALALDSQSQAKIKALEGKVLELIIAPLGINFYVCFSEQGLELLPHFHGPVDTTIHSSPLGLIRLSFLPASQARSLFNEKIRLSGDVELGQQIQSLFAELDIDWEGHLAQFTGDVVAHQVGKVWRRGLAFGSHFEQSMRGNLRDYLQEELRFFPPSEELHDFFEDIDQLKLAVERLAAKINLLAASS